MKREWQVNTVCVQSVRECSKFACTAYPPAGGVKGRAKCR